MFQKEIEALDEYDFCSVCFRIVRKCDFFVCLFFLLPRLIVWHQVQKTKKQTITNCQNNRIYIENTRKTVD